MTRNRSWCRLAATERPRRCHFAGLAGCDQTGSDYHDRRRSTSGPAARPHSRRSRPVRARAAHRRGRCGRFRRACRGSCDRSRIAALAAGYDLREVTRELGKLNECVIGELDAYTEAHPGVSHGAIATARRIWSAPHQHDHRAKRRPVLRARAARGGGAGKGAGERPRGSHAAGRAKSGALAPGRARLARQPGCGCECHGGCYSLELA